MNPPVCDAVLNDNSSDGLTGGKETIWSRKVSVFCVMLKLKIMGREVKR